MSSQDDTRKALDTAYEALSDAVRTSVAAGLTIEQIAAELGVSADWVARLLDGDVRNDT